MKKIIFKKLCCVFLLLFFVLKNSFSQSNTNCLSVKYGAGIYSAYDCWGYTDGNGREYGILASQSDIIFYDITDENNVLEVASKQILWYRDVKTYKNYCYAVSDVNGRNLKIYDMSN